MKASRERKVGVWVPVLICLLLVGTVCLLLVGTVCLLLVGTVWFVFRQAEAQKRTDQLFVAIHAANPAAMQLALDGGASANSREMIGTAPVGPLATVRQWLVQALHPDQTQTALTAAVNSENPECVRLLLDRGAAPNLRNGDGRTAFLEAAGIQHYGDHQYTHPLVQKQLQTMQMLLDKGADISTRARNGSSALGDSVEGMFNGSMDLTVQRFLLAHGADVNAKSQANETVLEAAVDRGGKGVIPFVSLLLAHGAKVNVTDSYGWTPLRRASENGDEAIVKLLLQHNADPNIGPTGHDKTPLILAAYWGKADLVKLLLDKGADVNAYSETDSTALYVATQIDRADIVKMLLERGADPNHVNKIEQCEPALDVAAFNQSTLIVRLLIAHGADVNLGGEDDTPLTAAADAGLLMAYCKRRGFEDPGDIQHLTPVVHPRGEEVSQILLAAGANANEINRAGIAPLTYAVAGHNLPLIRLLLAHGAKPSQPGRNVNAPGGLSETPLQLASERGYTDLTPLLR